MVYSVEKIQRDVRIAMDDYPQSPSLIALEDVDAISIDKIIKSKIEDAAKAVEIAAPLYMLDSGHNFAEDVFWNSNFSGWTVLPDNFMRLIVFRMSDWERPVYAAISEGEPEYAMQHSRFKGIRGNPQKPVCAITIRAEGKVLEFYSCNSDEATVEQAVYLPVPKLINGGIEICEQCYRPFIYQCAGMTAQVLGENDSSAALLNTAQSMIT